MKKAIARAVARRATQDQQDVVLLWSAVMWLAALVYLLATFDPLR